jgi:hypothetical protein
LVGGDEARVVDTRARHHLLLTTRVLAATANTTQT